MRLKRSPKTKAATTSNPRQVWGMTIGTTQLVAASAAVACVLLAMLLTASDPSSTKQATSSPVSTSVMPGVASASASTSTARPVPDSTYIGCLRTQDDGRKFVLTEVGGANAPRTRNWKTLFVTKKSGKLEVTPAGTIKLRQHVGQTVQLTGQRTDGRFAARSVKMIGSTCS